MKLHAFLDLDNTLVCSEPLDEFDIEKNKEKIETLKFYNIDDYYITFERPYLQETLDFLFKNCLVSVFTAASKDYALTIIKNSILDPLDNGCKNDRKLEYILFDYHCSWSKYRKNGDCKSLELLWNDINLPNVNKKNTIIIDDLPEVSEIQPENSIKVKPFEITEKNAENDNELIIIMSKVQKFIDRLNDEIGGEL
jgi:hypothetical protein